MPKTIKFYYIFYNQHFYAYVNEDGWKHHAMKKTIMGDSYFTVYTVTLPY